MPRGITKSQKRVLDDLWSSAVKEIAGRKCEMCGSPNHLQSHHVIGRRYMSVRFYLPNGVSLCAKHHLFAEQNEVAFSIWILKYRGQEWWNDLQLKSQTLGKYLDFVLLKAILELAIQNPREHNPRYSNVSTTLKTGSLDCKDMAGVKREARISQSPLDKITTEEYNEFKRG